MQVRSAVGRRDVGGPEHSRNGSRAILLSHGANRAHSSRRRTDPSADAGHPGHPRIAQSLTRASVLRLSVFFKAARDCLSIVPGSSAHSLAHPPFSHHPRCRYQLLLEHQPTSSILQHLHQPQRATPLQQQSCPAVPSRPPAMSIASRPLSPGRPT